MAVCSISRQCKICGKNFIAKSSRRQICYEDHYRICEICGTSFVCNQANSTIKTCSEKCRRKMISKNSPMHKKYKRICKVCGKEYYSSIKDESRDLGICNNVHIKICQVCGKPFQIGNKYLYYDKKTCSNECRYKLSTQTWHDNEESNLQNMKDSLQEKYGVDYTWQIPDVIKKSKQTCLDKYGETSYCKTQEFKDRLIQQNQKKYGVDWYMQTAEYWQKAKSTWKKKYGVDNPSKAGQVISGFVNDPSKIDILMEFRDDPKKFIQSRFGDNLPTLQDLADLCGIRDSSIGWILTQTGNRNMVSCVYSYIEKDMYEFLSEFIPNSPNNIQRNTFQVITPYELDLYLPEYNFAIECNPTSTHNSTNTAWGGINHHTDKNYHKMKTDMCSSKGVFLFHVFGYEWSHKKDIIKSMIKNALGYTDTKIYARNTEIRDVSSTDAIKFLELNHRQGRSISKVRLGLYYKGELVSLMTFGKMRNTIGTGSTNLDDCYELVRFCNKINTIVVGGASKLFKYFIKCYSPSRIRSFSDKAHTTGSLYRLLGFEYIHESDPGYVWVDTKTDIAVSRVNAQKQNIRKFLKDDTIDLSKTEVEIMVEHGFVQVYDSGTILWEWRCSIG